MLLSTGSAATAWLISKQETFYLITSHKSISQVNHNLVILEIIEQFFRKKEKVKLLMLLEAKIARKQSKRLQMLAANKKGYIYFLLSSKLENIPLKFLNFATVTTVT